MPNCHKCNDTGTETIFGFGYQCTCPAGIRRVDDLLPAPRVDLPTVRADEVYEDPFAVFDN